MNVIEGKKEEVRRVEFGKGRRDALLKYLEDEHVAAEQERSAMRKRWEGWTKQANSRLTRPDAGPRDSKIDMPLTRERLNQASARLLSPIFQSEEVMAGKPRTAGPMSQELAQSVEGVMDYALDRSNAMEWSADWVEQFSILPFGVVKTAFTRRIQNIKRWEEIDAETHKELLLNDETDKMVSAREFDDGSEKYFVEIEDTREEKAGVFPEVVPATDFFFKDAACPDDADWVTHRTWQTRANLAYKVREGIYDDVLDTLGEPSAKKEELFGVHEKEKSQDDVSHRYDIRETYLAFAVDKEDGEPVEIIVTWERTKRTVLRVIHNFYHGYVRPFVMHQFKHVVGSMYGIPATFDLEYPHKAYSASINQRLDAASKALETVTLVPPGHPLEKQMDTRSIRGGIYQNPGYSKDDIIQLKLSEPGFTQLPQLENIFEQRADRVMHIPPAAYGEQPNRPNATAQLTVSEQSQFPQNLQLERFRESFSLVVKHMLMRYRQFYPEGMRYYVQQEDPESIGMVEHFFQWPARSIEDDVLIETAASSGTMSKMMRKQETMALLERMPQLYQGMYQMSELAMNPMNPAGPVAVKLLNGQRTLINMFFKEFEIGKREELNPELTGGMLENTIQQLQQMVQQLQQQTQQLMQQGQGLQVENAEQAQTITALSAGLVGNPEITSELGGLS